MMSRLSVNTVMLLGMGCKLQYRILIKILTGIRVQYGLLLKTMSVAWLDTLGLFPDFKRVHHATHNALATIRDSIPAITGLLGLNMVLPSSQSLHGKGRSLVCVHCGDTREVRAGPTMLIYLDSIRPGLGRSVLSCWKHRHVHKQERPEHQIERIK